MDIASWQRLLATLEGKPDDVQLYYGELEAMIAKCMERVYELAKEGGRDEDKMELTASEYRARLLLERWKKRDVN